MSRIVHFEQSYDDPGMVLAFYKNVFGWEFKEWSGGDQKYWTATTGPENEMGINGGFMEKMEGLNQSVINTLSVEDIESFVKKIEDAGGKIARPKMAIPGMGYVAYLFDPGGILFGIFQNDMSAV
jgi:uncharacterized protein